MTTHQRIHRYTTRLIFACAALALACTNVKTVRVYTAAGQQNAISKYKTFGVLLPDPVDIAEARIRLETMQRLADLSVQHMKGLGYKPIAAERAELIVALSPKIDRYELVSVSGPTGRPDATVNEQGGHVEGALQVSFVDVKQKSIVLARVAQARVDMGVNDDDMRLMMSRVFEDVPRAATP